ncbi:MAG: PAS domain S-box protein [Chthoniobacterales bacterium]
MSDDLRTLDERSFRQRLHRATFALSFALGLPLLALLVLVIVLLRSADWVEHSSQVIARANALQSKLLALQTSFRGYRLSTDESYLEVFAEERRTLPATTKALSELVSDNPSQAAQLATLNAEADRWLKFVDAEVARVRGDPGLIRDRAFLMTGGPIFRAARDRLDKFVDEERRLRVGRDKSLRRAVVLLLATLGVVALVGVPLLVLWLQRLLRRISNSYEANLRASEIRRAQLRVTLNSIGDAVVATDERGKVNFLNPAAEALMGWTNAEASGRELAEVFPIFNERTRAVVPNPVERVLRENRIVGLANHTILRTRDGREMPIEDSAAPIRGDDGEVTGVILVFHDVTEKRAVERDVRANEARLHFLNQLGEATRGLMRPSEIMETTTRMLGEHLHASRCAYAEVHADGDHFTILHYFIDGCESTVGDYELSLFGPRAMKKMRSGETLMIRDLEAEITPEEGGAMFDAIAVKAIICCPLVKQDSLRAMMAVHQTTPRDWTDAEIALMQEVAERCWATIERKRAEAALSASENLKAAIIDTSLDGFILMNHEGLIADWNSAAERIFGHKRSEITGSLLGDIIVPERLREAHRKGLARYVATREARILGRRYELPALRKNGEEFSCEISITHIPGTEPPLFAGYTRDISAQKESEAALQTATRSAEAAAHAVAESAERFRLLSEVVSLQVWTARSDGQLDFANAECLQYFGVPTDDEVLGNAWTQFVHPEDLPRAASAWKKSITSGAHYEVEFRLRAAGGNYRWFLVRAEAVRDDGGRVEKWFGTNTDIDDLKGAQAEAERSSRAKDNFLAVLSHELRTPLTPVLMTASALYQDERLPADVRSQLGMMERNIALEARLIDDLLDLTRITRGKLPLRPQLCDAHSLIGLALEIVRDEAQAKGITLEQDFHAEHSGLMADPSRFQQVIWNLLRNAVKFTPQGGSIKIRTRDFEGIAGARWLCIEVSDSGVGIDAAAIDRIFQPFEQADLSGDHRFGGVGLGLSIARAIVDLHGGSIRAESAGAGQGALFTVELPGATRPPDGAAELPDDAKHFLPGSGTQEKTPAPANALHLLVVEDHEATLQVLTRLLTRAGHQVVAAASVTAALEAASQGKFDLVLSDLGLPDGTGNNLMEKLRDRYQLRGIALTGYGMEDDLERSRQSGFVAHLIKPVDFNQLRRALAPFEAESESESV